MSSQSWSSSSHSFHDTHSDTYERMASRSTLNIALAYLPTLLQRFPITSSSHILDNACGTGLVTGLIKAEHPSARITAADLAPSVIEVVKRKGWESVDAAVLDVRDLKSLKDETFSHVITNFGFAPDVNDLDGPGKAAGEMFRVVRPGGVAVVTTWSERNFTTALHAAALRIRPRETPFSWDVPPVWDAGWWLFQRLEEAFGNKVEVTRVEGRMEAKNLEELASNMLLFKDMFYKGYSEEELGKLHGILMEEIRKLDSFYEEDGIAAIKMVAWVGVAWK
ncbi:S-adenosyl-L-methionine-dependent methyltransferase [Bisporella sp. PMI_857]|nr:S-adenosyl-L-methionine-dependent methyltransferase [Bisporella sp. PMI_857]